MDDVWQQWRQLVSPLLAAARPESIQASLQWADGFRQAAEQYLASLQTAPGSSAPSADALGEFLRHQAQRAPHAWTPAMAAVDPDWPSLGPGREHQQRWQRLQQAAARAATAQQRLQELWAQALRLASEDFLQTLPKSASEAANAKPDALYARWIECAEARYAELAQGDAYADTQAEWINAGSAVRAQARAWLEQWCQWLDLPTRTELNTLQQRVKSLEQQLRANGQSAGQA